MRRALIRLVGLTLLGAGLYFGLSWPEPERAAPPDRPATDEPRAEPAVEPAVTLQPDAKTGKGRTPKPLKIVLLKRKAYAALRKDQLGEAIAVFEKILELRPEDDKIRKLLERLKQRRIVEADFERYESGRFSIKYDPLAKDLVLRRLSVLLETAWSDVGQALSHYPEGTLGVVVYADREAYRKATGAPDWMGALFDGRVRIPVDPEGTVDAELERIARHEMTHFVLRERAGKKVPQWLHEGLAQHLAGEEGRRHRDTYHLFVRNNTHIPIRSIEASFLVFDRETANHAYHQSLSMARYILDVYGTSGLDRLIEAYAGGKRTPDAFVQALGVELEEFQRAWFAELIEAWAE